MRLIPILALQHLALGGSFSVKSVTDLAPLAVGEDQLCNPSGINFRYSGLRLYQTMLKDLPVRHFWYLARCVSGKIVEEQYFATNRTENFQFGKPVCLKSDECYVLARQKKYAPRNVPIYKPMAKLGAVYRFNATDGQALPHSELIADNMALSITLSMGLGSKMKYIPILYSSMDDLPYEWDRQMETNPAEDYEYTEADGYEPWSYMNSAINKLGSALVLTDKLVFWEFDALQTQLDGLDWRRLFNKIIPNAI